MHCNGNVKVTKVFYISFRHRKETLEYKRKEDQTMEKQWWWQMGGLFTQSRHSSHTLCSAALYQNMFRYICCSCYFHVTNIKHRKLLRNWQNVFVGHCHWPKGSLNKTRLLLCKRLSGQCRDVYMVVYFHLDWWWRAVVDYAVLYWAVLGCTWLYWSVQGCTWLFWNVVGCIWLYWAVLGSTGL